MNIYIYMYIYIYRERGGERGRERERVGRECEIDVQRGGGSERECISNERASTPAT